MRKVIIIIAALLLAVALLAVLVAVDPFGVGDTFDFIEIECGPEPCSCEMIAEAEKMYGKRVITDRWEACP